jgi:hypothetical protein
VKAKKAPFKAETEAKVDHGPALFDLLSRPEQCTVREMMDGTGLTHSGLKLAVSRLLKAKGLKVVLQRNPQPDPQDRKLTSYLYGVEKV